MKNYYNLGLRMRVQVLGHGRLRIGAVNFNGAGIVPSVEDVAAQAKTAALDTQLNKGLKYFGYARLVPQDDISPEDQQLTKNSDDQAAMQKWLATATGDPQMVWAGYFDNSTHKLVASTLGEALVVKMDPPAAATKSSGNMGLILGIAAAGIAGMVAFKPKKGHL